MKSAEAVATDKEIGERLRVARVNAGFETAADAARAMDIPYGTYAGHENGHRGLRSRIEDYGRRFGVTADWLLTGVTKRQDANAPKTYDSPNVRAGSRVPIIDRGPTIPLYGHAVGGQDGEFVLNGNKLDDILAPPSLSRVNGAYAVTVAGESMEPRYLDGETIFVDPERRVIRGDFVVAQVKHPDGEGNPPLAYIKRFLRRNAGELVLEQYNPPKELRFANEDVVSVHFIVASQVR